MQDQQQNCCNADSHNHHHHDHCITFQDVLDAAKNIQGIAYKTPVMTSSSVNCLTTSSSNCNTSDNESNHLDLFFKVEAMQRTGSFKFRGALNAIQSLVVAVAASSNDTSINDDTATGTGTATADNTLHVVTHSSGNHAAAVALAAKQLSPPPQSQQQSSACIQATIVMPKNAPTIKVQGVQGFGGNIVMVESTNEAREEKAEEIMKETGAYFIHPSENPRVIAGQGTVCLEFVEQVRNMTGGEDLDIVIIPVGGGGLAAGNAVALRGLLGNAVKVRKEGPKGGHCVMCVFFSEIIPVYYLLSTITMN
jgi:Threonine dehydratase